MRPTAPAMQRPSDKNGVGGVGKAKVKATPRPASSTHCTIIHVTANGLRSPQSATTTTTTTMTSPGTLALDDNDRAGRREPPGKKPQHPPSSKSSPAPPPPPLSSSGQGSSPKGPQAAVNGHSRHRGSDGSISSHSSVSGGSVADADFYSSLPELPPDDSGLAPAFFGHSAVASPSSQKKTSFPPSPDTSGYSSPSPSPRTAHERHRPGPGDVSNGRFRDDADYDAAALPPPADDGAEGDSGCLPTLPSSPPPDYYQNHPCHPPHASDRSSGPRPFSEADSDLRRSGAAPAWLSSSSSSSNAALPRAASCPAADEGGDDAAPKEVFYMHVQTTPQAPAGRGGSPQGHAEVVMDPQRTFAGRRDVRDPGHLQEKQIVSVRGTVRGFKNRVRAGINTFVDSSTSKFNYLELEKGKIVVYTTSMTVVRETFDRCKVARNILQTHMVRYEERDLYMSHEHQRMLAERLEVDLNQVIRLPQVFIDGIHIGGATHLEKLNENGELRKILQPFPKIQVRTMCDNCGGYRFVPCAVCHGSKKSVHRNNFTEEFCALRCMHCNENGLQRCHECLDQQE